MKAANIDPEDLYHPDKVRIALLWAEMLEGADLLAAARINDSRASGHIPSAALVRLIRRYRVEGKEELSTRLTLPLIERAHAFVLAIYEKLGFGENAKDIAQEAIKLFLTELAQHDEIDWWEITFYRELRRRAATAYRDLYGRYWSRGISLAPEHEASDGGTEAGQIVLDAALTAFAAEHLNSPEKRVLFVLLMKGDYPIHAPEAAQDLVRITGKPRSTLANLKTEFVRLLKSHMERTS